MTDRRKYTETRIQAQKNAIRRARETAQLARMLWPKDAEDDLHGKVEILSRRLHSAGQHAAARKVDIHAHPAAWRKVKHTQHISDEGDITRAPWWVNACECRKNAKQVLLIAAGAMGLDRKELVDAAYWAAKDILDEVEDAQYEIPYTCSDREGVLPLWHDLADLQEELQRTKDDLVSWAEAHDYTITRNPT